MTADVPARDVLVVGAGMAGLTTAYDVARSGRSVSVLERDVRVGGLVRPLPLAGGITLDAGAEAMGTRRPAATRLATELGLELEHPPAASWVQPAEGEARPVPPRSLLGIPSDLAHPAVVALLGAEEARRAAERDRTRPVLGRLPEAASLADVVRLAMGEAVLDLLVRPIAGALHAADPADLALDVVAPGLRAALATHGTLRAAVASLVGDGPVVAAVRGGMYRLPAALARAAVASGADLRTGTRVDALVRDGDAWLALGTPDAPGGAPAAGTTVLARARRVVVAVPGPAALGLLEPHLASAVDLTPGAPVEHRTLVLDAPALDDAPRGSGLIVARGATPGGRPVRAKALTHASAKWPWVAEHLGGGQGSAGGRDEDRDGRDERVDGRHERVDGRHALRLSYGRPGEDPRGVEVDEALADAAALLGVELDGRHLVATASSSHAGALAPQTPATRAAVADLADRAADLGLHLTGAWVSGTGLPAVVAHARGPVLEELAR